MQQYGWCGNTTDHCGAGCISGCTGSPATSSGTGIAPRPDGMCGAVSFHIMHHSILADFNRHTEVRHVTPMVLMVVAALSMGRPFLCLNFVSVSIHNISNRSFLSSYCGSTPAHCGAACQNGCTETQTTAPLPVSTVTIRIDGRCGSDFDGAGCDTNGPYGGCCSPYGHVSFLEPHHL